MGSYILSGGLAENLGSVEQHYHANQLHFMAEALVVQVRGGEQFAGFVNLGSKLKDIARHPGGDEPA